MRESFPSLGSTTHISVLDNSAMACSITTSNGEGCGYVVPGTGAMANNFMGEEDLHPEGFHTQPAGKRLSSMMCPTVVCRDGQPVLVLGTGGSNRIRTAILQILVHHLLRHQPIEQVIAAPRLHFEGSRLYVERRGLNNTILPTSVLETLQRHNPETIIFDTPNMFFGGVHAVAAGGHGAGDARRGGAIRVV
ncbi:MAG: gamma-glutamyltransferase [Myxococcota bacterium]